MGLLLMLKNRKRVLGMNERNLRYIRRYNLPRAKEIVDNKILTKKVLENNNIPTPELIDYIPDFRAYKDFDWNSLPKSFVMKPVQGLEGSGIQIFYNKDKQGNWIKGDGSKVSLDELKMYVLEILDGKFSLHNQKDGVLFEERVKMHKVFKYYAYKGAPDVRIIVYNNVPIMSYVRLPTKESEGKGNLAKGAIGAAIDMVTGTTTGGIIGKTQKIETIPGTRISVSGLKIPNWDEILKIAIRAQRATNLGFAAIDFLIDRDRGPVIVELNARPGLSIQLSNEDGLRWRLRKAAGLKILSISKGVRIAKDLFGGQLEEEIERVSGKEIVSHIEPVELYSEDGTKTSALALIDTSRRTTTISEKLAKKVGIIDKDLEFEDTTVSNITFNLAGVVITTDCRIVKTPIRGYKLLIGRKDLGDFLVDIRRVATGKEAKQKLDILTSEPFTDPHKIDDILAGISSQVRIIVNLRPNNYALEKNYFYKKKKSEDFYNPQFSYNPVNLDTDRLIQTLAQLRPDESTELGKIFVEKINHIKKEIYLLEAIGEDDKFPAKSASLFGNPSEELFNKATNIIKTIPFTRNEKKPKYLSEKEVRNILQEHLDQAGFIGKLVFDDTIKNKASIQKSGEKFTINPKYKFTKELLMGTIAHEIDVHLYRAIKGAKKPYKIFSYGTANYIEIEEGLAVWNKARVLGHQQPVRNAAIMYIATYYNYYNSFDETYKSLIELGLTPQNAFRFAFRSKRGMSDTSKPGAYLKDMLYLTGYLKVDKMSDEQRKQLLDNGKTHEVINL